MTSQTKENLRSEVEESTRFAGNSPASHTDLTKRLAPPLSVP